ncbi:MAG: IS21 family transposase [Myxococcales bacterium]|nr:IS21 family transposase [Myxococcales bacterium]
MMWLLFMAMMGALMPTVGAKRGIEEGMIPLLKRHEIQVLLKAGFSARDVAERSGTSVDTVRRVRREDEVQQTDDRTARAGRRVGRPSKAAPFASKVSAWLKADSNLPTQELLRRAKEVGYVGNKSAFYGLVAGLRPPRAAPVVRFEGLPGEFSQHDFGQVDVTYVDGRKQRIHFFASRLKYSRYAAVTLVENERVETVVRCLARDFVTFGGLPLMAVFDRPRSIVTKGGKGRAVEEFNATFAQAIVDIGVGVEMCAPRSGNQKGSVERLVGWVKSSFFKHRKFLDETDLRAQLAAWHVEVNTKTPSRATGEIPERRRQAELARLRPIKVIPEDLPLRLPIFVGPTAEVMFEGVPYSMPPEATHVAGTVFLYEDRLLIVAGRFRAEHRRRKKGEPPAPLPEHRAAKIAAVHGKRAKLYQKRQHVLDLGPDALTLLTELTHRDPKRSSGNVEELFAMLEKYGDETMRAAISRAVQRGHLSVAGVRRALSASMPSTRVATEVVSVEQPSAEDATFVAHKHKRLASDASRTARSARPRERKGVSQLPLHLGSSAPIGGAT